LPVSLDPFRHQIEHLCSKVRRAALRVLGTGDEAGIFEDPEMLVENHV